MQRASTRSSTRTSSRRHALILFAVATAGVKGFALDAADRHRGLADHRRRGDARDARVARRLSSGSRTRASWARTTRSAGHSSRSTSMSRRSCGFGISGLVILVSLGSLATRHLNLGIDFKAVCRSTFKDDPPTRRSPPCATRRRPSGTRTRSSRHRQVAEQGQRLQGLPGPPEEAAPAEQDRLTQALKNKRARDGQSGQRTFSSSFGRQIAKSAIIAVLFSLLVITLTSGPLQGVAFAVPVIIALLHDLLITSASTRSPARVTERNRCPRS